MSGVKQVQVTFDCAEPERRGSASACEDPDGTGPRLFFQRVPEGKEVKNRLHLDVRVHLVRADGYDESCLVMRDIEGNEFCLD